MKKLVLMLALVAGITFSAGNAHALLPGTNLKFDLDVLDAASDVSGVVSGQTGVFSRFSGATSATSTYNTLGALTPGNTFTDVGRFTVNALQVTSAPDSFLNAADSGNFGSAVLTSPDKWEMYAEWSSLTGSFDSVTGTIGTFSYNPGSIISLKARVLGGTAVEVASLKVNNGASQLDFSNGLGSVNLGLSFDSVLSGFWLDQDGNDYEADLLALAIFDVNILGTTNTVIPGNGVDVFTTIESANGTNADVLVPEPATMILFGSGLMGFMARRKKKVIA